MNLAHRLTDQVIADEAQLRALIGSPFAESCAKITDRLNSQTRRFIGRALLIPQRPGNRLAQGLHPLRLSRHHHCRGLENGGGGHADGQAQGFDPLVGDAGRDGGATRQGQHNQG